MNNTGNKFDPTPEQLNGTLEHIYYEIDQLYNTHALIRDNNGTLYIAVRNALIESLLIHVRTLLDFFEKLARDKKRGGDEKDDVLSSDYGFEATKLDIDPNFRDRLNKDLAHLTYSRSQRSAEDWEWPMDKVAIPVLERSKQFCEHMVSNYLPLNCPGKVNAWQALIDRIKMMTNNVLRGRSQESKKPGSIKLLS